MESAESKDDSGGDMQIGGNADFKPGQKYPTPAPANGDRVFYESLLEQKPSSEMAQEWCVAYGVLEASKATKLWKIISQRKGVKTSNSPLVKKAVNNTSKPRSSKTVIDDDVIVDTGK